MRASLTKKVERNWYNRLLFLIWAYSVGYCPGCCATVIRIRRVLRQVGAQQQQQNLGKLFVSRVFAEILVGLGFL